MTTYFKAVREDGTSFHDPEFVWFDPEKPVEGRVVTHPGSDDPDEDGPASCLSVSVEPADCTGFRWPCVLLEVEPVEGHEVTTPDETNLPHKRAATAWRVVRRLDAHLALGPNGKGVSRFLDTLEQLSDEQLDVVVKAWDAAWNAAGNAARAAMHAARAAAGAARFAAWDAAAALVVADLLAREHLETLWAPFAAAGLELADFVDGRTRA